jgi:hypothetical protein
MLRSAVQRIYLLPSTTAFDHVSPNSSKLPTSGLHHPVLVYEKSGTMTSASQKATLPLPVASHQTVGHAKFLVVFHRSN